MGKIMDFIAAFRRIKKVNGYWCDHAGNMWNPKKCSRLQAYHLSRLLAAYGIHDTLDGRDLNTGDPAPAYRNKAEFASAVAREWYAELAQHHCCQHSCGGHCGCARRN